MRIRNHFVLCKASIAQLLKRSRVKIMRVCHSVTLSQCLNLMQTFFKFEI
jgi:hypothetical protein